MLRQGTPIRLAVLTTLVASAALVAQVQPPQQRPIFRAGAHFVQVDAYPRRDGKVVEGLTAKDFQVFEDGKPQSIETVDFIRVDLNTPETERRDPNSQAEGNQLAADSRNRVFVLYFDHFHNSLGGSDSLRRPIGNMLNRMLTATDLFALATVYTRPQDLIFGRKSLYIEEQLETHWTWGLKKDKSIDFDPDEQFMEVCYGEEPTSWYVRRTREERTLDTLGALVRYLGAIREARKVVVIFTRGWPLARPDMSMPNRLINAKDGTATPTRVGVGPGGRLMTKPPEGSPAMDLARCNSELTRAGNLDNDRRFRDLLLDANRHNVTFYPVNPDGLGANYVLRTLAENTDGVVSNTNDHDAALRRITDDVSAYYVLGYYTANSTFDGNYRKIDVKMTRPGIDVRARRGYVAPKAALTAEASASPPAAKPFPKELDSALEALVRQQVSTSTGELLGAPIVSRGTPALRSPLLPAADLQFRRTERAHIEWPLRAAIDRRDARLLSKDGSPLAVPVTLTERESGGVTVLAADLVLAPLAAGDYVVELSVGAGEKTERRFVAIRVRP